MLFTEARFVLLVAGCWLTFRSVRVEWRSAVLAGWGALFYTLYAPAAAPLVFGLIAIGYVVPRRFWWVAAALALGILAYYKFETRDAAIATTATANTVSGERVLLPLGLSFLAFELVHVEIERQRGRLGQVTLADYLAYALYFPCRVAGPIKRYPEFQREIYAAVPTIDAVYHGFVRVLAGIAKKVVLADFLGLTVSEMAYAETPAHLAKVLLAYSFEIYLDFSAYSDMAIGVSRMFGIVIPENFRWPYLSQHIQEFWTRWHISLSSWVRDYVFLPFGRWAFATPLRPHPIVIAVVSYLVSFLIVGAWHGLTANFILWGLYHGALLGTHHAYRKTVAPRFATQAFYNSFPARVVSVGMTFALVSAGWVFFLTPDPAAAARFARLLIGGGR